MVAVLNHNDISVRLLYDTRCCGMPKLELGDLKAVEKLKDANLPIFLEAIDAGYDLMSPDSVLRADVQTGNTADVPRRPRCGAGKSGIFRSFRISDAAAQGGVWSKPISPQSSEPSRTTLHAISACRTSA